MSVCVSICFLDLREKKGECDYFFVLKNRGSRKVKMIGVFLDAIDIPKKDAFTEYGVERLDDLELLEENDWAAIGVTPMERIRITRALEDALFGLLVDLNYEEYIIPFKKHGIYACFQLKSMTDEEWEELEVKPFHRKMMLQKIK